MATNEPQGFFYDPLQALEKLLSLFGNQGVIIGGIAVSLLGQARFTEDLDAMVLLQNGHCTVKWSPPSCCRLPPQLGQVKVSAMLSSKVLRQFCGCPAYDIVSLQDFDENDVKVEWVFI